MKPSELLEHSRELLQHSAPSTAGLWPRAAALLARQALETALDDLWSRRAPGLERCSSRAQLLCLAQYLGDEEVAATASFAWACLSRACHHHVYELPPTAGELAAWIDDVDAVIRAASSEEP